MRDHHPFHGLINPTPAHCVRPGDIPYRTDHPIPDGDRVPHHPLPHQPWWRRLGWPVAVAVALVLTVAALDVLNL